MKEIEVQALCQKLYMIKYSKLYSMTEFKETDLIDTL